MRAYAPLLFLFSLACGDKDGAADDTAPVGGEDTAPETDADGDGFDAVAFGGNDCDDADAGVYPGADEYCDEVDSDCDDVVDEDAVDAVRYVDADGDGYGQDNAALETCDALSGTAPQGGDCDDADADRNPGEEEICDGFDNDCDELIDDEDDSLAGLATFYQDNDLDGYGDEGSTTEDCEAPFGYAAESGDCDDADAWTHPGAAESESSTDCMRDADEDGYGDADATGDVVPGVDCDDDDAATNPGASELCDGADNDCDPSTSEDGSITFDGFNYSSLDTALLAATGPNPTISICAGEYTGPWTLSSSVTLEGPAGPEVTILNGNQRGATLKLNTGVSLTLSGLTITDGVGDSSTFGVPVGGGIYGYLAGDLTMSDCIVEANSADYGGGVFLYSSGDLTVSDCLFQENQSTTSGGGLYAQGGTLTDVLFLNNTSSIYAGAALMESNPFTLDEVYFEGNVAEEIAGAAIVIGSRVEMVGGAFTDNSTNLEGSIAGGLYLSSGAIFNVDGATFDGNSADYGGAAVLIERSELNLTSSSLTGNAAVDGGAVYVESATLTADGTEFSGNVADNAGGAFVLSGSDATLTGSVVESNSAGEGGGGGVWMGSLVSGALTLASTLTSDKSDWGFAASDNTPEDVNVEDTGLYDDFGSGESFTCDSSTGACD